MGDLTSARVIYFKAILFVLCGLLAGAGVMIESPTLRTALLLGISIWCFCRAYYFAFYVIEHYVVSSFRFAGLGSFAAYLLRRKAEKEPVRKVD